MTQNNDEEIIARAATYVRVSSVGQMGRDGDEDGYSIPAQIAANKRKAEDLGAELAKAYVERAESARSDSRPVLQQMLKELPGLGVQYLIVHKVDRLARNRLDDAMLYQRLQEMGITLVSASENIDETPAGRLMHGMLATFAEYYSNNLANEVKKGLHEKHRQGGTPFRAPIGYLHERKIVEGQDVRTVVVDPDRAPLVQLAFELYGSGQWTLIRLTAQLESQGLVSRPTPKRPASPLGVSAVHRVLTNPYYVGVVRYAGNTAIGRHEPLVDQELFDQVQSMLLAGRHGERASKHEHYLRGTVVCEECGGRLLFGRHRGRSSYYDYFCCVNRIARGRQPIRCGTGHYGVADVECKVEEVYASIALTEEMRDAIRTAVRDSLAQQGAIAAKEAARHQRRIAAIEANQAKLVQMYLKDLASEDVLREEQARLTREKQAASRLLKTAEATLAEVQGPLEAALELAADPQGAYLRATPLERRMLNATFFECIEVGVDGELADIKLMPVYDAMKAWAPSLGEPAKGRPSGLSVQSWSFQVHLDPNADPAPRHRGRIRSGVALRGPRRPTELCAWRSSCGQRRRKASPSCSPQSCTRRCSKSMRSS
jgi:DNA invertase Pin-like site-specific DNA recombinase